MQLTEDIQNCQIGYYKYILMTFVFHQLPLENWNMEQQKVVGETEPDRLCVLFYQIMRFSLLLKRTPFNLACCVHCSLSLEHQLALMMP